MTRHVAALKVAYEAWAGVQQAAPVLKESAVVLLAGVDRRAGAQPRPVPFPGPRVGKVLQQAHL